MLTMLKGGEVKILRMHRHHLAQIRYKVAQHISLSIILFLVFIDTNVAPLLEGIL